MRATFDCPICDGEFNSKKSEQTKNVPDEVVDGNDGENNGNDDADDAQGTTNGGVSLGVLVTLQVFSNEGGRYNRKGKTDERKV